MLTSIIGFPRVGNLRELKFATEKYFKHQISQERLQTVAKEIREKQWRLLKENGIDLIPSNDFSFYDTLLDSAALFNIIPSRYKELNLSDLDTYFAMSRGYQGDHGDVRALAMKKWFNTNYHYMVPEIEDDTEIKLTGTKLFDEFHEALHLGILTKPVITGPFTLLKLIRYTGEKQLPDFVEPMIHAYEDLISKAQGTEISWIQFDEPYLVHDLSSDDIALFKKIYTLLLAKKGNLKVLVQTYFGDVRDIYHELTSLDFDGIGLDFIEGKETKSLIKKEGFPKNKLLFVGIVNGKNIWKNHYGDSLATITWLKNSEISTVINTSCSLLHVPYTLKNETKLDADYTKHFAFAEEKLEELNELKILSDLDSYETHPAFIKNLELFSSKRKNSYDPEVSKRVSEITDQDFTRLPDFFEREKIQKDVFKLPLLSTTTIGSFPQTLDVKTNRSAFRKGEISESEYVDFNRKKIAECVKLQEEIGLDVLVHGEYERNDMVEYFGQQLNGYLFTEKAWVQSYGTRCVKPPIIWGDVYRKSPITVEWSVYAQSLTKKPMKGMLTGPVTILNWSFPREDISTQEMMYQIGLAIREEVLELEAAGVRIIQIDEAALREKLPLRRADWHSDYLNFAIKAFRLCHAKVKPETQIHTHMCYSEFEDIIPEIDAMDADVITFEASRSKLTILDSLMAHHFETEVGPGVYDIHSPRIPSVEEIEAALRLMLDKIPADHLWVNPDCGLKTRGETETVASLKNMVQAAKNIRNECKGDI